MLLVNENRNGETITVKIGDALEIRLVENATTGFQWSLASACEPTCKLTSEKRLPAASGAPGAGGEHRWQLQAVAVGECQFGAEYRRPWHGAGDTARQFAIQIRVSA